MRLVGRLDTRFHVQALDRNLWDVYQVDVAVQATVKGKVAQIGRDPLQIARVVAKDGNGDLALLSDRSSDVHSELIVATNMARQLLEVDKHFRHLPRTFEMQQRPAARVWIGHAQVTSIPTRALVIR